ncbi:hypothetical protein LIA77_05306 [Sarocladium implicatum]|nr:hypothetical protein LIA77_05306 [Sarocladium implicatum]
MAVEEAKLNLSHVWQNSPSQRREGLVSGSSTCHLDVTTRTSSAKFAPRACLSPSWSAPYLKPSTEPRLSDLRNHIHESLTNQQWLAIAALSAPVAAPLDAPVILAAPAKAVK